MKIILPLATILLAGSAVYAPLTAMESARTFETHSLNNREAPEGVWWCGVGEPLCEKLLPGEGAIPRVHDCIWWKKENWSNLTAYLDDRTPDSKPISKDGYPIGAIQGVAKAEKGWIRPLPQDKPSSFTQLQEDQKSMCGRHLVWFVRNRPLPAVINYLQGLESFRLHFSGCENIPRVRGLIMYWHQWLCMVDWFLEACVQPGDINPFPVLLVCDGCNSSVCQVFHGRNVLLKLGFVDNVYVLGCKARAVDAGLRQTQFKAVLHSFYCRLGLLHQADLAVFGDELLRITLSSGSCAIL